MSKMSDGLFDLDVWRPALENYGAVTRLTVALYDRRQRPICEPIPPTPLFALFRRYGLEPAILSECARLCLHPVESQPPVIVSQSYGLAAVGVPLMLDGATVGAAVAGYALVDSVNPLRWSRWPDGPEFRSGNSGRLQLSNNPCPNGV